MRESRFDEVVFVKMGIVPINALHLWTIVLVYSTAVDANYAGYYESDFSRVLSP